MDRWHGRVALVTGASVGIGKALCESLVQNGLNVVGCARNIDKLAEVGAELSQKGLSGTFKAIKCDLRNESEIKQLFSEIKAHFGRIDICINNAGLGKVAPLVNGKTEYWKEMLDINVLALSICTRESIELMLEKNINDGHIIHLSSVSAHRVVHKSESHFYAATKFAVRALAEGLRQELRELKSGIRVTLVSPGLVQTEFAQRLYENEEKASATYSSIECLQPKDIAQIVIDILKMPIHVEINDVILRPTNQVF